MTVTSAAFVCRSSGLRAIRTAAAAVLLGLLCTSHRLVQAQATPYTFYKISDDPDTPAMDVNDDGTVVGYWDGPPVLPGEPDTNSMGYLWTRTGGPEPIVSDPATVRKFPRHTAVNDFSSRLRINGAGTIAGVGNSDAGTQAAIWSAGQGLVFLESFDGAIRGRAVTDMNESTQVTGWYSGGGHSGLFIWSAVDGFHPITGFDAGYVTSINVDGVVVGARATGTRNVAVVWSAAAGHTDIPDVPGATYSIGLAINDSGVVVGRYIAADQTWRVFRWSAVSGTEDLNAPPGEPVVLDINNAGDIVSTIDAGGPVPYLYQNDTWTNLNDLLPDGTGFTLQFVEAINNHGWIVGAGTTFAPAQLHQGFVLVPPNRAPVTINSLTATPGILWPPNHKMVPVSITVDATDGTATAPTCSISAVHSNEASTIPGETDWMVTGPLALNLRSERLGFGAGRFYTITVTCTNTSDLNASNTVQVSVPHDQRRY
jgi:hypothetical protein